MYSDNNKSQGSVAAHLRCGGSVATLVRCGGIFNVNFIANFLVSQPVKEL